MGELRRPPDRHRRLRRHPGLPLASNALGAIAAIHLPQNPHWCDIAPTLAELYRVLGPAARCRVGLPHLDRALRAHLDGDTGWFYVPDRDARSAGAKLVTQIIWYGSVHTPMTFGFIAEWMERAAA